MSSGHQASTGTLAKLRVPLVIWLGSCALTYGLLAWAEYETGLVSPILEKFRGNLFSGFVSMGSVLMAMKTFIVVRLQEKLYGEDKYKEVHRRANQGSLTGLYLPLRNLSDFLIISVF